jgi:aminoglycoside 3-N-acetyltransferase
MNDTNYTSTVEILGKIDFSMALIHSDIVFGFAFDRRLPAEDLLWQHYRTLKTLIGNKVIWMPSFCYDYTTTRKYDVQKSPSQVGMLTEFFRTRVAKWRSPVPVFSFTGDDEPFTMPLDAMVDPFDKNSLFQTLIDKDALIIHYGVLGIYSSTIIHYCERISGKLCYRYDKLFPGTVENNGRMEEVTLNFHVRPKGYYFDYDWSRLETDLVKENLLKVVRGRRFEFRCIKAKDVINYWIQKINDDPLYLLDSESRSWVEPRLQQFGRPFILSDFE